MTPPQDVGFPASDSVSWPVRADPAAVVPATRTGRTSAVVDNAKSEVGVTGLAQKGATLWRCQPAAMWTPFFEDAHWHE